MAVGGGNMKKIIVLLVTILLFNIYTVFAKENPSLTVDNLALSIGESYNININNKIRVVSTIGILTIRILQQ